MRANSPLQCILGACAIGLLAGCPGGGTTGDGGSDAADAVVATDAADAGDAMSPRRLPSGPQLVAARPGAVTGNAIDNFGVRTGIAIDENGDPGVAWSWRDPNNDGNPADSVVYFSAWNPVAAQFPAPVTVGPIGQGPISVAYDAMTHTWAVARQSTAETSHILVAFSTDRGMTWTDRTLPTPTGFYGQLYPSIALRNGTLHLAYVQAGNSSPEARIAYVTGSATADAAAWTSTFAPFSASATTTRPGHAVSIALDSAGAPGLAYWLEPEGTPAHDVLAYWRPSAAAPIEVATSSNTNTLGEVQLGYNQTQPRIVFVAAISPSTDLIHTYWSTTSTDGATWAAPVGLPLDNSAGAGLSFSAAVSRTGHGAGAYVSNSGGTPTPQFPALKSNRTNDFGAWTVTSPDTTNMYFLTALSSSLSQAFDADDALYLVFTNTNTHNPPGTAPTGIIVWRL